MPGHELAGEKRPGIEDVAVDAKRAAEHAHLVWPEALDKPDDTGREALAEASESAHILRRPEAATKRESSGRILNIQHSILKGVLPKPRKGTRPLVVRALARIRTA